MNREITIYGGYDSYDAIEKVNPIMDAAPTMALINSESYLEKQDPIMYPAHKPAPELRKLSEFNKPGTVVSPQELSPYWNQTYGVPEWELSGAAKLAQEHANLMFS